MGGDMNQIPRIKGWCPGAWQPMASGDGLLVRVRPFLGRLTRRQALALCDAAERFGTGLIEVTNRANLQLRGVSEQHWSEPLAHLAEHGLVDADPDTERRRNMLVAPDWQAGDDTHQLATRLMARLGDLPELPGKVGFAIDAGTAPLLAGVSADFRVERSADGGLLVRADGHARGTAVISVEEAVEGLVRLAHWFVDSGGWEAGRMRRHQALLPSWAPPQALPAACRDRPVLGRHPQGLLIGIPFGRVTALALREVVQGALVGDVRVTPWRRLLIEGGMPGCTGGLPTDEADPRLAVDTCPGAPWCHQASVETRRLAEALASQVTGSVHVSGCRKGCARRQPATLCLTGRDGRFDLIVEGRADGVPVVTGLSESDVIEYLKHHFPAGA